MAETTKTTSDLISEAIKRGVQSEVEDYYEVLKKEMLEKLDREKDIICAGIVLNVTKTIDIQTITDRTIITIRKVEA